MPRTILTAGNLTKLTEGNAQLSVAIPRPKGVNDFCYRNNLDDSQFITVLNNESALPKDIIAQLPILSSNFATQ